jgi:signal transduction histidine kinase
MKRAAWASSATEFLSSHMLALAVWLVAVPMCGIVVVLSYKALDLPPPVRIENVQRWVEPLEERRFDSDGFVAIAENYPDTANADWRIVALPDTIPTPALVDMDERIPVARLWIRTEYTPQSDESRAIHITRVMGGACEIWVNGTLVFHNPEDWRHQWNIPVYYKLSQGAISAGKPILIEIALPFRLSQGYAFGSMYIGPTESVQMFHAKRVFWHRTVPNATMLVTLLLGILALHFWYYERSDRAHLMLGLTALAWFVTNVQYFGDFNDPLASLWFGAVVDVAAAWLLCFITSFALTFDQIRRPRLEKALLGYVVAATLVTLPIWKWQMYGLVFQHLINFALAMSIFGFLTWVAFRQRNTDYKLVMCTIWTPTLFGLHDLYFLTSQRSPDHYHIYPYTAFFMFGTFLIVIQQRYLRTRHELVKLNASLNDRLRLKEEELKRQHEQLLAVEQQRAVHGERRRLMRDMHDGVGTALMSSLVLAERGNLDQERTARVLRETLDELKLVIDSLEPTSNDIVLLLANLRYRFGQRIEDAGIKVHWQMEEIPPLSWLDPTHSLHILRIVQETFQNILKHAHATEVRIGVFRKHLEDLGDFVVIHIADNGIGFKASTDSFGRGLKNLRARAHELHGKLCLDSHPGEGTSISLYLPQTGQ